MADRLKIGQEVLIHGYVDEIRSDTIIIRNEGGYFGTVECEVTDIEMPNMAIRRLEAWDKVLNFISDRIKHWDAPCSGDEAVRKELASVMWEIRKRMKEVEE